MNNIINKNYESFKLMTESKWDYGNTNQMKKLTKNSHFANFKLKTDYYKLDEMISKLQVLTLLKAADKILYIRLKLKQISVSKEKFIIDLEQGKKILLSSDLVN